MMKFAKVTGLFAVGAMMVGLVGCGALDPTSTSKISIDISAIPSIQSGTAQPITGTIKSEDSVSGVVVTITDNASVDATSKFTLTQSNVVGKKNINIKDDLGLTVNPVSATNGSYTLKITVTAGGASGSNTQTFSVTAGGSGITLTAKTGTIANVFGPDTGAFDLVTGKRIPSTGAETVKDLKDLSLVGAGFAGELGSGNSTTFIAATSTDYDNATDLSVKALGATATASSIAISNGTVFVAKLGSGRGYAIVKITRYAPTVGASATNKGEADFSYKFTL